MSHYTGFLLFFLLLLKKEKKIKSKSTDVHFLFLFYFFQFNRQVIKTIIAQNITGTFPFNIQRWGAVWKKSVPEMILFSRCTESPLCSSPPILAPLGSRWLANSKQVPARLTAALGEAWWIHHQVASSAVRHNNAAHWLTVLDSSCLMWSPRHRRETVVFLLGADLTMIQPPLPTPAVLSLAPKLPLKFNQCEHRAC